MQPDTHAKVSLWATVGTRDKLKDMAAAEGRPMSQILNELVEEAWEMRLFVNEAQRLNAEAQALAAQYWGEPQCSPTL